MTFRIPRLGRATAFGCELIGLLALFLAPEVEKGIFLAPVAIALVAWGTHFRLRDRLLLLVVAFLVLAGYATAAGQPTGTLLARALLPAHALLWLARSESSYRFWRLGIALMELVLAAILSPEAHMFVMIFFFVALSSLALALGYLERVFRSRDDEEALERPLHKTFLPALLSFSILIFLCSLLIFPLLPRARWSGDAATAGYTDKVTFRTGVLYWDQSDSGTAAWIFRDPEQSWNELVPFRLLRGEALESFDGLDWRPGKRTGEGRYPRPKADAKVMEIMRQAMPSEALMVPYGAKAVGAPSDEFYVTRSSEGEWRGYGSHQRSVKYQVQTGPFESAGVGAKPSASTLHFPSARFPEIKALGAKLAARARSQSEKIDLVSSFFQEGGFSVALDPMPAAQAGKPHPVEDFLFRTKRGHCELFATSAALLYRAMGVPARLVIGFRLQPPARGDVLTVRNSDAHAWIEIWKEGQGWVPADYTPSRVVVSLWPEYFSDSFDWVSAYWHRYIIEYEFDFAQMKWWTLRFAGALAAVAALWLAARALRKVIKRRKTDRERLSRLLDKFSNDLLHVAGIYPETAFREIGEAQRWLARYGELRFGRKEPTPKEIRDLRRRASRIVAKAARELIAAS